MSWSRANEKISCTGERAPFLKLYHAAPINQKEHYLAEQALTCEDIYLFTPTRPSFTIYWSLFKVARFWNNGFLSPLCTLDFNRAMETKFTDHRTYQNPKGYWIRSLKWSKVLNSKVPIADCKLSLNDLFKFVSLKASFLIKFLDLRH